MSLETQFSLANAVALVGWIILALAPLRRPLALTAARTVGVALAVAYTVLFAGVLLTLGDGGRELDFSSLAGVTRAFAQPEGVLLGWVHYLAFDLWVGAWAVEDAGRRGLPHWAVLPCLVFILMAGPFGLLLYLGARVALSRRTPG